VVKKKGAGGRREGSGRKVSPDGRTVVVSVSVPESLVDAMVAHAKANGWSKSRTVTEAIRNLVQRKTR
jgi:hypothetical protein